MSRALKQGEVLVSVNSSSHGTYFLEIGDNDSGERVAGPKAWGGGHTVHEFVVSAADLVRLANLYGGEPKDEQERVYREDLFARACATLIGAP